MEHSMDERLALLDEKVRAYLTKALKAQQSATQTDCMVDYLRDMLLKVSTLNRLLKNVIAQVGMTYWVVVEFAKIAQGVTFHIGFRQ